MSTAPTAGSRAVEGSSDSFDSELALRAPAALAAFNRTGVLSAADVHVAMALLALADVPEPSSEATAALALATALAVRAPRLGHVFVDLATVAHTVASEAVEAPASELPWPEPTVWRASLEAADTLVARGDDPVAGVGLRPLRLVGTRLYLDRYWRQERALADILRGLDRQPVGGLELPALAELLTGLFPDDRDSAQRAAAASAALRGLTVVAGGPGTGKTTTVARTVALLGELATAAGQPMPLIALCAPTGRAAARLAQAIAAEAAELELSPAAVEGLDALSASTIHRLLGARGEGRFRHTASNPLPHDIVIVDETSMVSLSLISHLLSAVRADARVVLVGDPDQLSAIEAGAVLRDIVGPATGGPCFGAGMRSILTRVTGTDPGAAVVETQFGSGVVVLRRGHRFGTEIGALAEAVRNGEGDRAVDALRAQGEEIRWLDVDTGRSGDGDGDAAVAELRAAVTTEFGALLQTARGGDAHAALEALGRLRVLCAHREGRYGVRSWTLRVEQWLAESEGLALDGDYAGRPLMITENDHELRLYNGDAGVITAGTEGVTAAFEHETGTLSVAPARLAAVETAYASTIHKSQGSQFTTAAVMLPDPQSRLLTRELLYTAITRARTRLIVVGTEAALRAAIDRPVQRATGLRERLWGV